MPTPANVYKPSRRKRVISLTPLIDVVFILLVFFMLASSFQKTRMVNMIPPLPQTGRTDTPTPDTLIVEVLGGANYRVGEVDHDLPALERRLRAAVHQSVLIKTGMAAELQDIVDVLDLGSAVNLEKLSLMAVPAETRP